MRKRLWQLAALAVFAIVVLLVWIFWAIRQEPEFYRQALAIPVAELEAQGNEMFNRSQRLAQQAKRPGKWQAQFTAQQINGFLAIELPKLARQNGQTLPSELQDPRVEIAGGQATLAVRYEGPLGKSVVSLAAEVFLASPQEVGVRLKAPRAGALPLPLGPLLANLENGARQAGVDVRWRQTDGDPVALIRLSPNRPGVQWLLDAVELSDGKLSISGHTVGLSDISR